MGILTNKEAEERCLVKNKAFIAGTSFPEQFIFRSLLQVFPMTKNRVIDKNLKMEIDISIPELRLYIEYNGIAYHSSEEKQERDKIRLDYCKENKIPFIQIIETDDKKGLDKNVEDQIIKYEIESGISYKKQIGYLIIIINDIFRMFNLQVVEVDFNRAIYEAMLFSTKYQYKIKTDTDGNIIGRDYLSQVYCECEEIQKTELGDSNKKVSIKPVQYISSDILNNEYKIFDTKMFNGSSLEEVGLNSRLNYHQEMEILDERKYSLEEREKVLDQREIELSGRTKELEDRGQYLVEKEKILEKRYLDLNKLEEELRHREFYLRESITEELKDREMELQNRIKEVNEKEKNYKKVLDKRYRKQLEKLQKEYDYRHELLDSYCDRKIEEEVIKRTAEIQETARGQCEVLQMKLSEQRRLAARQMMKYQYGI